MTFSETLNHIMTENGITARALAAASGLSDATISRYRSGARVPSADSDELSHLYDAIKALLPEADAAEATTALTASLPDADIDRARFAERLRTLIENIPVSRTRLAAGVGYDPSFISRVISGERVPADYRAFASRIGTTIASYSESSQVRNALSELLSAYPPHTNYAA